MDKEDLELLIKEFSYSAEKWTELGIESIYRSSDLQVHNAEREFNLFLNITTLSVAFLTIVVPLIRDSLSVILFLAIFFFLFTSILGIIILKLTIKRDKRLIEENKNWEYKASKKYLQLAVDIRSKLYSYKKLQEEKLWNEIKSNVDDYFMSRSKLDDEAGGLKLAREKECSFVALKYLKILFWSGFILSILLLVVWIIYQTFLLKDNSDGITVSDIISFRREIGGKI